MQTYSLPKFILSYATALLSAPWRFTLVYLSLITGVSHDVFTRGLQKQYQKTQLTDYQQKLQATFDSTFVENLNLSSYFNSA